MRSVSRWGQWTRRICRSGRSYSGDGGHSIRETGGKGRGKENVFGDIQLGAHGVTRPTIRGLVLQLDEHNNRPDDEHLVRIVSLFGKTFGGGVETGGARAFGKFVEIDAAGDNHGG